MAEGGVFLNGESKEQVTRTRIGMELEKAGGFGDILHMAKIAGNLSISRDTDVDVYSNRVTDEYLSLCTAEFGNAVVHLSSAETPTTPDILITTTLPSMDRRAKTARIHLEEYSHQEGGSVQGADYVVAPGLAFDPADKDRIQTGLTDSFSLKEKISRREEIQRQTLAALNQIIEDAGLAEEVDLANSRLGIIYTSSLSTNYSYIEGLSRTADQQMSPTVILCISSGVHGYSVGFSENSPKGKALRKIIGESKASFYDLTEPEDLKFNRNSNVTFLNLGRSIPHDLFEGLLLTVDFPSVITGDQSLAEAIQIASTTKDAPPFLYYGYFGNKAQDYLKILGSTNPQTAAIAADFLLREHIPDDSQNVVQDIQEIQRRYGHITFEAVFTDAGLQTAYQNAQSSIPAKILEQKRPYIPLADQLVWESDTVKYIIEAINNGEPERINLLKPR